MQSPENFDDSFHPVGPNAELSYRNTGKGASTDDHMMGA